MTQERRAVHKAVETANQWLDDVTQELDADQQQGFHALQAVLATVRDRLTLAEAAHLSAQLPLLVRGIYFEGWRPADQQQEFQSRQEFLDAVGRQLAGASPLDPHKAVKSVFSTLKKHCDAGEIEHVKAQLPAEVSTMLEAA